MYKIFQSIWLNVLVALGVCSGTLQASASESHLPPSLAIYKATHCSKRAHEADYVIVGLGTAGSVLARYLSDPVDGKFKNSVLVLEAGQNRSNDPNVTAGPNTFPTDLITFDPRYAYTQNAPLTNFFFGAPIGFLNFSCGRMWFGSSAHNYMGAFHGSSDRWDDLAAAVGNNQWSYNSLLPFFKFLETYNGTTTQPSFRGSNGPLQLSQRPFNIASDPNVIALSTLLGAPILPDYNVPDGNTAVTVPQSYSTPDFNTRSFGLAFLPPSILSPDGVGQNGRKLRVLSGAYAVRVVFEGDTAIGVEYFLDNGTDEVLFVKANKQVILCAGAPFSAALLQRSGIGSSAVLNDPFVNIPVLVDNPLVGTGLKTHYGVVTGMTEPTVPYGGGVASVSDGRNFFAPAGTGDNLRRFETLLEAALVIVPLPILDALSIDPFTTPGISTVNWYLRPSTSGTAFIVDANPLTPPDIQFNFYGDPAGPGSDLSAAVSQFYTMQAFAHSIGSTMIYPPESHFSDPAQLAADAGSLLQFSSITVTNHYSGTCNMGTDITNGVVSSSDLHVFGTKHLMVADNSIYPFPETGNTAWQAYVAGLMAAYFLGFQLP